MNLTSKRVLQFMTVCAGACALSASAATEYVADSFEEGPNGSAIGLYKPVIIGSTAHAQWVADTGDASVITNGIGSYGTPRPMDTTKDYVLNLATEGQTLSRRVLDVDANPVTMPFSGSDSVYVDTLIKFTPSEDSPVVGGDVKVAVFVNVNSNLVVHHTGWNGAEFVPMDSVFPAEFINPANWYRLTIQMGSPSYVGQAFQLFLDGRAITNEYSYFNVEGVPTGGTWFLTASSGVSLSSVAFQGTGMIDELVLTDTKPAGIGSLSLLDQWKTANGVSEEDWANPLNQPLWYYDYLLNIAEGLNADIAIDSITVSGSDATIVVVAVSSVDFTKINGQVAVRTSPDLVAWSDVTVYPVTYTAPSAEVVVTLPVGHKFIKAVVVPK